MFIYCILWLVGVTFHGFFVIIFFFLNTCSALNIVWMAKASASVSWLCYWDVCTWSVIVVGSTCLSLFSILWWDSCRENLKVQHLVYDERAAHSWWREMSLCLECPSVGEEFPHLPPVGIFVSCLPVDQRSSWASREMSLVAGVWRTLPVCRQKHAFVSQCWASS